MRNNIITNLAGTSLGGKAAVLGTSTLTFVYSVAEYCASVWSKSEHCKKVETEVNHSVQVITDTVRAIQEQ